jgi:hypothetical protein
MPFYIEAALSGDAYECISQYKNFGASGNCLEIIPEIFIDTTETGTTVRNH